MKAESKMVDSSSMKGFAYLPGEDDDSFVPLSRTKTGTLFKKHILSKGTLNYPGVKGGKVEIDDEFLTKLTTNFKNKVCDIVQVPVAGSNNEHTEDPFRNIGEVVDLTVENGKAYAYIDARDEAAANRLGKTLLGASAMLHLDYTDTRDGQKKGPTLLHVAVTNRPHVVELDEFEQLAALSSDSSTEAVFLTAATDTKDKKMALDLDEIISSLKEDHDIDLPALQLSAASAEKLTAAVTEAVAETGVITLSAGSEISTDDLVAGIAQIGKDRVELTAKVDALIETSKTDAAKARVASLVAEGKILPKNEESQVKLLLSNPELFEELLPETPIVKLSGAESGIDPLDEGPADLIEAEVARLSALAETEGMVKL